MFFIITSVLQLKEILPSAFMDDLFWTTISITWATCFGQNVLQKWFQESNARFWDPKSDRQDMEDSENSFEKLAYQVWNVSKYGACADAAITGVMPPPLMELQVKRWFLYFIGKTWRLF